MSINSVLAVVTVADFEAGLAWYERLFGRPADRRTVGVIARIASITDPEGNVITFGELFSTSG